MPSPLDSGSPVTETSWRYAGWPVAVAAMIALMFGPSTVAVLSLGIFIRPLEADFGWSRTQIALASSIVAYTVMLISPLQGYLVDRFGARRVMLPCLPLFATAVGLMYFLPPVPWVYYAAWIAIPALGIGLFPLSYLRVVSTWFERRLGLAVGIANAGIGLGGAVLPLLLSAVIATQGWRTGFLCMALLVMLVSFPAVLLFVREKPATGPTRAASAPLSGLDFRSATRSRPFALLAGIFVLLGLINTALFVHQIPLLIDAGLTPQRAALVQSTFGLFVILGRLLTGLVIDFVAPPLVMMVLVLGASAACLIYATGPVGDIVFVCAALLGMVLGAEFDVLSVLLKRYFGMRSFGKLYGLVFAVFQLGAGAGAAMLPLLRQATGRYREGLLVFALATLLCAVLLAVLHRMTRRMASREARIEAHAAHATPTPLEST
ncbi:MFS transporter [Roseateles chitinivorans]|uniref:MFS transporter n=1 Tax=Roseateles chitinivorans TaxID=2917965 RepID=UPI003D667BC9